MKNMLVIITKPPYGVEDAFAGFRFALSTVSNGMPTTVLMIDDGVFNAVKGQNAGTIGMPTNEDAIMDLVGLEVPVFVAKEAYDKRGLPSGKFNEICKLIREEEIKGLVGKNELFATF